MNINKNIPKTTTFSFDEIETGLVTKMIDNLDSTKSGTFGEIPANCLKVVSNISARLLSKQFCLQLFSSKYSVFFIVYLNQWLQEVTPW